MTIIITSWLKMAPEISKKGDHDSPTVTISTDVGTLLGIVDGSVNGMQPSCPKKLRATGNVDSRSKNECALPLKAVIIP